jgi:hypothetical protein
MSDMSLPRPGEHNEFDDATQTKEGWADELARAKAGDPRAAWRFRKLDAYCIMAVAHMGRSEVRVVSSAEINMMCQFHRRGRNSWKTAIDRTKELTGSLRYAMEYFDIMGQDYIAIIAT